MKKDQKKSESLNSLSVLYPGRESNPHSRKNWILNPTRLPVPPPGHYLGTANLFKYHLSAMVKGIIF